MGIPVAGRALASQVEENSWVLHQTVLRLTGGPPESEVSIDAVFAPFSPPPAESVLGPVVLSVPPTADKTLENEGDVKGRCVGGGLLFVAACSAFLLLRFLFMHGGEGGGRSVVTIVLVCFVWTTEGRKGNMKVLLCSVSVLFGKK